MADFDPSRVSDELMKIADRYLDPIKALEGHPTMYYRSPNYAIATALKEVARAIQPPSEDSND